MDTNRVVLGVDLGTQGARVLAINPFGKVVTAVHRDLVEIQFDLPTGWRQQNPESWWKAVVQCLQETSRCLDAGTIIDAICVTSTSGSVVALDKDGSVLYPAMMYNDSRSQPYVAEVRRAGAGTEQKLGYAFSASFALPKIVWLAREHPELFSETRYLVSPTDYIIGRLSGDYCCSDTSNALKTGFDLVAMKWPDFIQNELAIPLEYLPKISLPGKVIGKINREGAQQSGLMDGIPLVAGATDGVASQIASGAVTPGAWNSTLGTTLVIKGITEDILVDPLQRIYCHRHPEGWWMPGGASNTGCEWIKEEYSDSDPAILDQMAASLIPTQCMRYPLVRKGERFPFVSPEARGFTVGQPATSIETFAAGLEGLALLERLAYDTLEQIGAQVGDQIYVTGGGARSTLWLQIRASVLQRTLLRPEVSETAMGAALLAASGVWYSCLKEAAESIVKIDEEIQPQSRLIDTYGNKYQLFLDLMRERGYIDG